MAKMTINFTSEAVRYPITIDVVLPADHMVTTDSKLPEANKPYKTMYVLEGVMGNYSGPINYSQLMPLAEDYNFAVVTIGGANLWYSDNVASGQNYAAMVQDVVAFTRRIFNLSRKKEDTFIAGFSMGGYGSLLLGLANPDIFGYIVSLDAALNKGGILEASEGDSVWDLFTATNYKAMFNIADVADYANSSNDYEYVAEQLARSGKELPKIFMASGNIDGLFEADKAFKDQLLGWGYDVTWFEFPGKHNYTSFEIGMEKAVTEWLPLEDNFRGNHFIYFGPQASTQENNFPWKRWKAFYNVELGR